MADPLVGAWGDRCEKAHPALKTSFWEKSPAQGGPTRGRTARLAGGKRSAEQSKHGSRGIVPPQRHFLKISGWGEITQTHTIAIAKREIFSILLVGGLEGTPLFRDGVLYFSADYTRTFAVDAKSGNIL
jgi:hypothetical protein